MWDLATPCFLLIPVPVFRRMSRFRSKAKAGMSPDKEEEEVMEAEGKALAVAITKADKAGM